MEGSRVRGHAKASVSSGPLKDQGTVLTGAERLEEESAKEGPSHESQFYFFSCLRLVDFQGVTKRSMSGGLSTALYSFSACFTFRADFLL